MMRKRLERKKLKKNDKGIVGIGTLIVFIAMVLVAAIAAAVIINTAAQLQQRAQTTTSDTVHDLGIGLQIVNILAHVGDAGAKGRCIDNLFIYIELNPGADGLNLNTTMLMFQTRGTASDKAANLICADSGNVSGAKVLPATSHYFIYDEGASALGMKLGGIDPNNAYEVTATINHPMMDQDAILVARVILDSTIGLSSEMQPGSYGSIKFIPAGGGSIGISEFRVPAALDTYDWITID